MKSCSVRTTSFMALAGTDGTMLDSYVQSVDQTGQQFPDGQPGVYIHHMNMNI